MRGSLCPILRPRGTAHATFPELPYAAKTRGDGTDFRMSAPGPPGGYVPASTRSYPADEVGDIG